MGLMSLFGGGPLSAKKIDRLAKLAANSFAQPDVRMEQLQRLLKDGSTAAIRGALRRFAINAQGHIADEDEKKWLEDALVKAGSQALPPLRDYIGSETKLTYALRAYKRIAGEQAATEFFLSVLKHLGPDDYRSSEAKLQLVWQMSESLQDEIVLTALAPFLFDHSDDVRWAVLDLLERAADAQQVAPTAQESLRPSMLTLVVDDSSSLRIAQRAAQLLSKLEWVLPEGPAALLPALDDVFFLDKKRIVRRRAQKTASA